VTKSVIVYQHPSESTRVGVVVTTKCGNAVVRNRLRRRTRAICRELIDSGDLTGDVVIRFRCEGNSPSFDELRHELVEAIVR
jgi:ribonuclease P protein component